MAGVKDIEAAVAIAEAKTGVPGGKTRIRVCAEPSKKPKARRWTSKEDAFIREKSGHLSELDIAKKLGRTRQAVRVHFNREMKHVRPSKDPQILTGEHIAMGLGIDGKSVHALMDRKLMPGRRLPTTRVIRVVDRNIFMTWALDPLHWCYFDPARIGTMRAHGKRQFTGVYDFGFWEDARKAMVRARRNWKDKWLTPSQAGKKLGIDHHSINAAINAGTLKATRWGNWRILKGSLPKKGTFNAKGRLVNKIYPQGQNPVAIKIISTWWKGKKRRWSGGPVKTQRHRRAKP